MNEAKGSGCGLDKELIWTSTKCKNPKEYAVTTGASSKKSETICVSVTTIGTENTFPVRCCADFNDGDQFSGFLAKTGRDR